MAKAGSATVILAVAGLLAACFLVLQYKSSQDELVVLRSDRKSPLQVVRLNNQEEDGARAIQPTTTRLDATEELYDLDAPLSDEQKAAQDAIIGEAANRTANYKAEISATVPEDQDDYESAVNKSSSEAAAAADAKLKDAAHSHTSNSMEQRLRDDHTGALAEDSPLSRGRAATAKAQQDAVEGLHAERAAAEKAAQDKAHAEAAEVWHASHQQEVKHARARQHVWDEANEVKRVKEEEARHKAEEEAHYDKVVGERWDADHPGDTSGR